MDEVDYIHGNKEPRTHIYQVRIVQTVIANVAAQGFGEAVRLVKNGQGHVVATRPGCPTTARGYLTATPKLLRRFEVNEEVLPPSNSDWPVLT